MIRLIDSGKISGKMAKEVLIEMCRSGRPAAEVVEEMGGGQVSDSTEIRSLVDQAISANPKQAEQYLSGKTALFGFFVGQGMKLSGGLANPQLVNDALKDALQIKGEGRSIEGPVQLVRISIIPYTVTGYVQCQVFRHDR